MVVVRSQSQPNPKPKIKIERLPARLNKRPLPNSPRSKTKTKHDTKELMTTVPITFRVGVTLASVGACYLNGDVSDDGLIIALPVVFAATRWWIVASLCGVLPLAYWAKNRWNERGRTRYLTRQRNDED